MNAMERAMLLSGMSLLGEEYDAGAQAHVIASAPQQANMFRWVSAAAFTPSGRALLEQAFTQQQYEEAKRRALEAREWTIAPRAKAESVTMMVIADQRPKPAVGVVRWAAPEEERAPATVMVVGLPKSEPARSEVYEESKRKCAETPG